jgi:hypothetical protein
VDRLVVLFELGVQARDFPGPLVQPLQAAVRVGTRGLKFRARLLEVALCLVQAGLQRIELVRCRQQRLAFLSQDAHLLLGRVAL